MFVASAPYSNALLGKVAVFTGLAIMGRQHESASADTSIAEINSTTSGLFGSRLACGDIDGDGDEDLIVGRGGAMGSMVQVMWAYLSTKTSTKIGVHNQCR